MKMYHLLCLFVTAGAICAAAAHGQPSEVPERNAYFGDLHVHTSWSFDAYVDGTRTTPDHAYRYAKGEAIPDRDGTMVTIGTPLDFMAVTDHAEYLGVLKRMEDPESPVSDHPQAEAITGGDVNKARMALVQIMISAGRAEDGRPLPDPVLYDKDIMKSAWQRTIELADEHYEPGKFTTLLGYEWTSTPQFSKNLHRNVIFRDTANVPDIPFTAGESENPEDLWVWMEKQRADGVTLLAIPHNANMSGGLMYATKDFDGNPIDRAYAEVRARNEPVSEVVQIKGQSMTHPAMAPEDEFADFEVYSYVHGFSPRPVPAVEANYVRSALSNGLKLEEELGVNPFKFGLIGSSDTHSSYSYVEEDKVRRDVDVTDDAPANPSRIKALQRSSGGLAGIWAEENTREAIYDALARKETFATSGTRIRLRFFGGWTFAENVHEAHDAVARGYVNGVAMGQNLPEAPDDTDAPTFIVMALKDPDNAHLDRIQIVKGWIDADGNAQEKIYDVAWSGDREIDPETGKLPVVGNTVEVTDATYSNDIGAAELRATWTDPDFGKDVPAFYYVRALQIPTPRWPTYQAAAQGADPPSKVPATIKERAWSSPIWYDPGE